MRFFLGAMAAAANYAMDSKSLTASVDATFAATRTSNWMLG